MWPIRKAALPNNAKSQSNLAQSDTTANMLHILGEWTVASIPPNLESKSSATPPQFWAQVPPISDSSFPLHFGLLPLQGESFVKGAD